MRETDLLLVGITLVGTAGLSWILGLIAGARVQKHLSTPRRYGDDEDTGDLSVRVARLEPAENADYDRDPDRWTEVDAYANAREYRGAGTDDEDVVDALERVRSSDKREVDAVTRGFRGEDLNDREVREWLERFGL